MLQALVRILSDLLPGLSGRNRHSGFHAGPAQTSSWMGRKRFTSFPYRNGKAKPRSNNQPVVIQSDARCSPPKTRAASTPEPLPDQEPVAVSIKQLRSSDPPDCPVDMERELASHVSRRIISSRPRNFVPFRRVRAPIPNHVHLLGNPVAARNRYVRFLGKQRSNASVTQTSKPTGSSSRF